MPDLPQKNSRFTIIRGKHAIDTLVWGKCSTYVPIYDFWLHKLIWGKYVTCVLICEFYEKKN